jgi:hypothetical protein
MIQKLTAGDKQILEDHQLGFLSISPKHNSICYI